MTAHRQELVNEARLATLIIMPDATGTDQEITAELFTRWLNSRETDPIEEAAATVAALCNVIRDLRAALTVGVEPPQQPLPMKGCIHCRPNRVCEYHRAENNPAVGAERVPSQSELKLIYRACLSLALSIDSERDRKGSDFGPEAWSAEARRIAANIREFIAAGVPSQSRQDVTCEHGTAMDVHCCHCHSGFIFDINHECSDIDVVEPAYLIDIKELANALAAWDSKRLDAGPPLVREDAVWAAARKVAKFAAGAPSSPPLMSEREATLRREVASGFYCSPDSDFAFILSELDRARAAAPSPPPPGWQPLRDAVEAFIVAAENYRIHAVLPIFVPIDIEVKMLQTRNKLRELLALPLPPEAT